MHKTFVIPSSHLQKVFSQLSLLPFPFLYPFPLLLSLLPSRAPSSRTHAGLYRGGFPPLDVRALPPIHDGRHHLVQRDGHGRHRTVNNHLLVDLRVRLWHDESRQGVIRKAGRADRDRARGGGSAGPGVVAEVEQRLSGVAGLV